MFVPVEEEALLARAVLGQRRRADVVAPIERDGNAVLLLVGAVARDEALGLAADADPDDGELADGDALRPRAGGAGRRQLAGEGERSRRGIDA